MLFSLAAFCTFIIFISWPCCYFFFWYINFRWTVSCILPYFDKHVSPLTALSSSDTSIPHWSSSRDSSFSALHFWHIGWIIRRSWINPALRVSNLHAAFVTSLLTNPIGAALKWLALWTLTRLVHRMPHCCASTEWQFYHTSRHFCSGMMMNKIKSHPNNGNLSSITPLLSISVCLTGNKKLSLFC